MSDFLKDKPLLLSAISASFGFIFAAGLYKQSVDSKLEAHEKEIATINEELRYRATIRKELLDKMDSLRADNALITQRLSRIEGKLDFVRLH